MKLFGETMVFVTAPPTERQLSELASRVRLAVVPLARQLRQHAHDGVTPTQLSVIGSIARHGPISLSDLASRERLSPPMITKVTTALEEKGIVERVADERDRRVSRVQLTAFGQEWLAEGRARRNAWLAERLAILTPAERDALDEALPLIERLLEEDG